MLFEIALTVNPLAFKGFREVYEPTCAFAFAGGLSSSITVWHFISPLTFNFVSLQFGR
jgi:hypothetical protein